MKSHINLQSWINDTEKWREVYAREQEQSGQLKKIGWKKWGGVASSISIMLSFRRMWWACEPHRSGLLHHKTMRFFSHCTLRTERLTLSNTGRTTLGTMIFESMFFFLIRFIMILQSFFNMPAQLCSIILIFLDDLIHDSKLVSILRYVFYCE